MAPPRWKKTGWKWPVSEEREPASAEPALGVDAMPTGESDEIEQGKVGVNDNAEALLGFNNLPHPRALAFLGDAVYEIFLREWAVALHGKAQSKELHGFTVMLARASAQVALLHHLQPYLTPEELELIRQGRNVGVGSSRRAEQATHRQATGFEALLGALHLQQPERLVALLALAQPFLQIHWEEQQGV